MIMISVLHFKTRILKHLQGIVPYLMYNSLICTKFYSQHHEQLLSNMYLYIVEASGMCLHA